MAENMQKEPDIIKLEKFTIDDLEHLTSWIKTEDELIQFAGPIFRFPLTKDQIEFYLNDRRRTVFSVWYYDNNCYAITGVAELYDFSDDTNKIARVLIGEKSLRGKGIGTKIIKILAKYSFEENDKEFVTLNVYECNTPAIKCYEKAGFSKTDREPIITWIGGRMWKAIEMQIQRKK